MSERITDHVARALARLKQQFKDKPRLEAFLSLLVGPAQPLEDALWQLLVERQIDTAIGVQLDKLGKIVGERRLGRDDETYRRLIRARISTNNSDGLVEDLIQVAGAVLNDPTATPEVVTEGIAAAVLRVQGVVIDNDTANVLIDLLSEAIVAGVRMILEYSITDDGHTGTDHLFTFDEGTSEPTDLDRGLGDYLDTAMGGHLDGARTFSTVAATEPALSTDGPDTVYTPTTAAEWAALGLPVPTLCYPCQDSSATAKARPSIGGVDLLPSGSGHLYRQTIAGWTRKFLELPASGVNTSWETTSDLITPADGQSIAMLGYASVLSVGASRRLMEIGGDFSFINVSSTGVAQGNNNGGSQVGTFNYNDIAVVHPWIWYRDAVTDVSKVLTDEEEIVMPHNENFWIAGNPKGMGACDPADLVRCARARFCLFAFWVGHDNIDWKAMLTTLGWSLAY